MLNINGKLLDSLDENEYYLLSIFLNWGKKSHPKNDILLFKTGWGEQKLKKVKRSLKDKGLIIVKARFGGEKGRGRKSNQYVINSELVSKYNGFNTDENQLVEIILDDFHTVEFHTDEFKRVENHGGFKVLRYSIIENIKILKEEVISISLEEANNKILELEKEIESLKLKSLSKKEPGKHEFPNIDPNKKYNPSDKRLDKTLPFQAPDAFKTVSSLDFEEVKKYMWDAKRIELNEQQFTTACQSFADVAVATYMNYRGITKFYLLKNKFLEWIPKSIKHNSYSKNKPQTSFTKSDSQVFIIDESITSRNDFLK